jgi:2-oxoglutarate ferredoxin oxidoreductase subunit beta
MVYSIKVPIFKKASATNALGLTRDDYRGTPSTLCGGCGHDSISQAIASACFELNLAPHELVKLSGIGCSSKTPSYFVSGAHAFNAIHGRMAPVASGATAAHRNLHYICVSGDGDTANIGLGSWMHAVRRGINVCYIVENNGVFGLTKGQFSATADRTSQNAKGTQGTVDGIDLLALATQLGATFVARGFSGDKAQMVDLIKEGLSTPGFAFIDILSPCVSFNNHDGSTKSYAFIRDHLATITCSSDRWEALGHLNTCQRQGQLGVGAIYRSPAPTHWHNENKSDSRPLRDLPWEELCPGAAELVKIQQTLR